MARPIKETSSSHFIFSQTLISFIYFFFLHLQKTSFYIIYSHLLKIKYFKI